MCFKLDCMTNMGYAVRCEIIRMYFGLCSANSIITCTARFVFVLHRDLFMGSTSCNARQRRIAQNLVFLYANISKNTHMTNPTMALSWFDLRKSSVPNPSKVSASTVTAQEPKANDDRASTYQQAPPAPTTQKQVEKIKSPRNIGWIKKEDLLYRFLC